MGFKVGGRLPCRCRRPRSRFPCRREQRSRGLPCRGRRQRRRLLQLSRATTSQGATPEPAPWQRAPMQQDGFEPDWGGDGDAGAEAGAAGDEAADLFGPYRFSVFERTGDLCAPCRCRRLPRRRRLAARPPRQPRPHRRGLLALGGHRVCRSEYSSRPEQIIRFASL